MDAINGLKNSRTASPAIRELFEFKVGIFGIGGGVANEAKHYATRAERLIMVKALHKADGESTEYFYSSASNSEIKQKLNTSYNDKFYNVSESEGRFNSALVKLGRAQLFINPTISYTRLEDLRNKLVAAYRDISLPIDKNRVAGFTRDFNAVVKMLSYNTNQRAENANILYGELAYHMSPIARIMLLPAILLQHQNIILACSNTTTGTPVTFNAKAVELVKNAMDALFKEDVRTSEYLPLDVLKQFATQWSTSGIEITQYVHNMYQGFIKDKEYEKAFDVFSKFSEGFDADTVLKFVQECIANRPNSSVPMKHLDTVALVMNHADNKLNTTGYDEIANMMIDNCIELHNQQYGKFASSKVVIMHLTPKIGQ